MCTENREKAYANVHEKYAYACVGKKRYANTHLLQQSRSSDFLHFQVSNAFSTPILIVLKFNQRTDIPNVTPQIFHLPNHYIYFFYPNIYFFLY